MYCGDTPAVAALCAFGDQVNLGNGGVADDEDEDEYVLELIKKSQVPCVLVVNKVDKIDDKAQLLPWIEQMSQKHEFDAIIPLSAKTGLQVDELQIKLKLCVTHDLVMELLSFGDNMKVLQPKSLVGKIKKAHQKAFKQY